MWEPRYISGDKNVIGDDGIFVKDAASRIAGDAKRASGQVRIFEPFRIADGSQRYYDDFGIKAAAIRKVSAPHLALRVSLQGCDGDLTAQINAMLALQPGSTLGNRAPKRSN